MEGGRGSGQSHEGRSRTILLPCAAPSGLRDRLRLNSPRRSAGLTSSAPPALENQNQSINKSVHAIALGEAPLCAQVSCGTQRYTEALTLLKWREKPERLLCKGTPLIWKGEVLAKFSALSSTGQISFFSNCSMFSFHPAWPNSLRSMAVRSLVSEPISI